MSNVYSTDAIKVQLQNLVACHRYKVFYKLYYTRTDLLAYLDKESLEFRAQSNVQNAFVILTKDIDISTVILEVKVVDLDEDSAVVYSSFINCNSFDSCEKTINPSPTPTNTVTPTATLTVTPTNSVTPTNTVTPSITLTNTVTPSITLTATPTITPPPVTDPFFSSVSLLMHMDGTNGSTTFTDSSPNGLTVTANGNAQISTAQSKWGVASGYFDGSGDYLSCACNAFGTNNFTIEAFVRMSSFANYRVIYDTRVSDGDTSGFVWGVNNSGQLYVYLNNFVLVTGTLSLNTWAHVALTRASGTWRIFIDGVVQSGTYSNTNNLTRTNTRIGMDWETLYGMHGYIDDLRITTGVARYTSGFTPPAAPFPDA